MKHSLKTLQKFDPLTINRVCLSNGYFGLGKFISLSLDLQEDLLSILDLVFHYSHRRVIARPLNILIEALPGSGKSFFVKEIYKATNGSIPEKDFTFLTFNITNVKSPDDIKIAFRKVQSFNIENIVPIVFFDEIDSQINGQYVYPYFLSPMFDGKIFEGGNQYKIGPAVFFFASSKKISDFQTNLSKSNYNINDKTSENSVKYPQTYSDWIAEQRESFGKTVKALREGTSTSSSPSKLLDFLDRIDSVCFIPPTNIIPNKRKGDSKAIIERSELKEQSQLLICAMIQRHFPYVEYIESKALGLLAAQVMSEQSLRSAESIIFKSTPPPDGFFRYLNLPVPFRIEKQDDANEIKYSILRIIH